MKALERGLLALAFPVLVAGVFFTLQLATRSALVEEPALVRSPIVATPSHTLETRDASGARKPGEGADGDGYTDLYGNEVTDAIATYTFDPSGSLYELHSPQTELPRLGSPKS